MSFTRNLFSSSARPALATAAGRLARAMGKRGASAAAASGADDGNHVDEAEADDLMVRLARWRSEHPTRAYVGAPLEHVRKKLGMPPQVSQTLAGGVHTRLKKAG